MAPHPETRAAQMARHLVERAGALGRDRGGNIALLYAFISVPVLMLTGAAVDYGFATRLETKLQAATDATALLLCQTPLTTSTTALNALAKATLEGQVGKDNLVVDTLAITSNPRKITLTAHKKSTAFLGRFTGTTELNPGSKAQCATPIPKTFEIALVLDNTGSMAASSGGQSKLQALQTAATNFVNYVYTSAAFSSATKISIVPFAASVAVDPTTYRTADWIDQNGKSSYHWTNVLSPNTFKSRFEIFANLQAKSSSWGWGGCLETLPYPLNVQDGKPSTSNKDSYYVPLFAPDEPGDGSTTYGSYAFNGNTYYSFNSYIDDDDGTNGGTCRKLPSGTAFNTAQGRSCKYLLPRDASPTASNAYTGVPNGPNYGCTTKPLMRLTNNTTALKGLISSMAPLGSTNIHEGFMWGWRTLSPNSVFADGAAYSSSASNSDTTTINKIMIVMTDGANSWSITPINPNGSQYFAAGYLKNADTSTPNGRLPPTNQNISDADSARDALDALTAKACANAKATNISIYTIGFSIPSDPIDAQGLTLLQNCASSPSQFFVANDSNSLITAFNQIAASVGTLRLTQ